MSAVLIPAVIAMLAGLLVVWVAVKSWQERLPLRPGVPPHPIGIPDSSQ